MFTTAVYVLEAVNSDVEEKIWRYNERELSVSLFDGHLHAGIWGAWIGKFDERNGANSEIQHVIEDMFHSGLAATG